MFYRVVAPSNNSNAGGSRAAQQVSGGWNQSGVSSPRGCRKTDPSSTVRKCSIILQHQIRKPILMCCFFTGKIAEFYLSLHLFQKTMLRYER